ncbi:MAG: hypothetical protein IJN39_04795, partial [Clostridia bacterium]|nr:hypothetical protein [Clostridia bacterium]
MNVLILTISAGQGHHSTGQAIAGYFENRGHKVTMVDAYEYISPLIGKSVSKGYLLSTKYTKKLYGKIYRREEKTDLSEHENFVSV